MEEVIRDELKGSSFATAPIVATSTIEGTGVDELKRVLSQEFAGLVDPEDTGKPRLSVDRSFSVKGRVADNHTNLARIAIKNALYDGMKRTTSLAGRIARQ